MASTLPNLLYNSMLYNLMQLKMQQINAKSDTSDWEIEASMIFDHSKTGIVGSNPARGMDVCPVQVDVLQ